MSRPVKRADGTAAAKEGGGLGLAVLWGAEWGARWSLWGSEVIEGGAGAILARREWHWRHPRWSDKGTQTRPVGDPQSGAPQQVFGSGWGPLPEVDLATGGKVGAVLASGSKIVGVLPVSEASDTPWPGLGTPPPKKAAPKDRPQPTSPLRRRCSADHRDQPRHGRALSTGLGTLPSSLPLFRWHA